jgi:hypothetical protein
MSHEPSDIVLSLLREIRAEQKEIRADQKEMRAQIAVLAQGQVSMRLELKAIRDDIKAIREGMHEIAIAVDGHSARLDRIEHHLGLDANKH